MAAVAEHSNGGKPLRFLKVSMAKWDRHPQFLSCRKISEWVGQNQSNRSRLLGLLSSRNIFMSGPPFAPRGGGVLRFQYDKTIWHLSRRGLTPSVFCLCSDDHLLCDFWRQEDRPSDGRDQRRRDHCRVRLQGQRPRSDDLGSHSHGARGAAGRVVDPGHHHVRQQS